MTLIPLKCQPKVKESKDTGVHLISSKFSGSEGNEDSSCRVDYKNPLYTNNYITPLPNTTSSNVTVEDKSCNSATGYNTIKRSDWTSDAYDILSDYKKPRFDSTYDHLPTNVKVECGETYVTMHNRCDANQRYEDMAIDSSGVDDKTNVASQPVPNQYNAYEQAYERH
ncbi:hypothetical protein CHS0354_003864 [Potamilus streckersoni]|uniref:Uncharacterized protein n=1 Tax=Potamilus streckersoni TaxID=2493646 RepID=A0AAE0SFW8_9BIVA|nr:hypothetical protein CHS0354_003864 [Potamilus streckersoni]